MLVASACTSIIFKPNCRPAGQAGPSFWCGVYPARPPTACCRQSSPAAQRAAVVHPRRSTGRTRGQKIACQRHQALKKAKTGAGCHRLPARELRKAYMLFVTETAKASIERPSASKNNVRWSWSPPPGKAGRSAAHPNKNRGQPKAARGSGHIKQSQAHGASILTLHRLAPARTTPPQEYMHQCSRRISG